MCKCPVSIGEVYYLTSNDNWLIGTITGTRDTGRSYDILTGEGTSLRRNRSHLKPWSFDIPIINANFHSRTLTSSQSEINSLYISGPQHPPKEKYFHNNKYNNKYSLPTSRTLTSSQSEINSFYISGP